MKLKNFVLAQSSDKQERPVIEEIEEVTQDSIAQVPELCYPLYLQDEITIIIGNSQKSFTIENLIFKFLQIDNNNSNQGH